MTPRQRRTHQTAMEVAAAAPRKSYLGRFTPLTGIQSAWIKALLSVWGESMRGGTAPRKPRPHACWRFSKEQRWSDAALERFTAALEQARREGLRGQQALNRAHGILWPAPAISVIDKALQNDDVEFIEQCVLNAFEEKDPVYVIGTGYYTTRKKISDLTRDLQQIAPWLTPQMARERVKWCLQIFRAKVYLSAKKHSS
ncbi:TPA: hypothetical protein I4G17_004586 [Enterobacter hormaechei]|uniref:hypothetical protein n=1 Tax=Enterobacter hormaechei TaxID=158836 RepID=UPI0007357F8D|nr:hypothetical protein [Enterobacter hormaechei]KTI34501.1 hypothetical protein ASV05_15055 [Enterobacter hormaechei subsp. xiangfangensis]KTJ89416.1 hypothetical protein ASU73_03795 [Enterobacter hormaechei subsp. xiangfangensis]MCG0490429.1 hypothetical protein [Enterobacter hormaechei]MCG0534938.1 hypothetical protein [Enterobacter hormaechei]MCG0545589.1 hypothetical protein [Enterobacter hormaechei]